MVFSHTPLLFADVGPCLIHFNPAHVQATHELVVEGGATVPDPGSKAHDGIAVDAGKPLGRPDGASFGKSANDLNLLVKRENVHRANPWVRDWPARTFKKAVESAIFNETVIA